MAGVRVKICGITNRDDALHAVACGADALGFVFYSESPRCVTPEQVRPIVVALPPFVSATGLFVNASQKSIIQIAEFCRLDVLQLHGDETPADCRFEGRRVIKALRVRDADSLNQAAAYPVAALLLDAWVPGHYGGTGECFNWALAAEQARSRPIILAGGLNPENVAAAVETVRPFAVDVSSGVESAPGRKDPRRVADFIRNAKSV
ncbi:phosphoribosylanthranilate isomerase [Geoalkalibacter halelectricus]|uniref:N-(5'-phosphoribosyl)anthranilate isomerase n=1 Tax=Geoalkalibacter halelectricus TaxID=2847045 RepID=A0ABY5ZM58_9BACT|nr:phosphoribosylanthranilate isomerase [Geoalkalibacter halelectricus]MDO3379109.1 phosphoribosylanthranilate isomerase [Geoalkalibacter halelectricus]UWZ78995.1 phosphoribosylanthranilate isomerase [Geoalkalibacter halelectricus]